MVSVFWIIIILNNNIHLNILKPGQCGQVRRDTKDLYQNPKRETKPSLWGQSKLEKMALMFFKRLHGCRRQKEPEDAVQTEPEIKNYKSQVQILVLPYLTHGNFKALNLVQSLIKQSS